MTYNFLRNSFSDETLTPILIKNCLIIGALFLTVSPKTLGSTGTSLQVISSCISPLIIFSMESIANWALFLSEGKKTIPTAYWPSSGNFILEASNSFLKNSSGT